MKNLILFVILVSSTSAYSQKYTAEKSFVSFYSHATIEDIKAENTKSTSIYNAATGDVVFVILIHEFQFAKSLMQEHFNEKYMDSEKYPKATFQGKISGVDTKASGEQKAQATGKLTIHGVTKEIDIPGTVEFANDKVTLKSTFIIKLDDYGVERPKLMWQNIAEQVEVKMEFTYKPL